MERLLICSWGLAREHQLFDLFVWLGLLFSQGSFSWKNRANIRCMHFKSLCFLFISVEDPAYYVFDSCYATCEGWKLNRVHFSSCQLFLFWVFVSTLMRIWTFIHTETWYTLLVRLHSLWRQSSWKFWLSTETYLTAIVFLFDIF